LDAVIANNDLIKEMPLKGKLLAYADDLFIIADDKTYVEKCLTHLANLGFHGLHLNIKKTQIMTDRQDMEGCT
jgi:hypothetical protein